MFKSDWCKPVIAGLAAVAIALGIAGYILGFQLDEEYGNAEYSADYHEQYATDKTQRECLGGDLAGRELHDCIEHQVVTSYEHHTAYTDLAAQTRMANWAMIMGVLTGAGVLVTLAGVIYVALTLSATRAMAAQSSVKSLSLSFSNIEEKTVPVALMDQGFEVVSLVEGVSAAQNYRSKCAIVALRIRYRFGIGDDNREFQCTAGYSVLPVLGDHGALVEFHFAPVAGFWNTT